MVNKAHTLWSQPGEDSSLPTETLNHLKEELLEGKTPNDSLSKLKTNTGEVVIPNQGVKAFK